MNWFCAAVQVRRRIAVRGLQPRYERGSTLVTSNLPFQEWTEVLGSERLTGALLDRLTHHVHILEMNGESYRLKQSKRKRGSRRTPDPPTTASTVGRHHRGKLASGGGRLPLRPKRAAFQAAQASAPDASSPTIPNLLPVALVYWSTLLRLSGLLLSALTSLGTRYCLGSLRKLGRFEDCT